MIYFNTSDEKHVLIIDLEALDLLRQGNAVISPDGLVFVAISVDESWTAQQFQKEFTTGDKKLTAERMKAILAEGLLRPDPRKKPNEER